MTDRYQPSDERALSELLCWAAQGRVPLELTGAGSKRGLGRPVQAAGTLDLSGLRGVTLYEPNELVMRARAGTPLAEITALLAEHRQHLAFEPADYGALLGGASGQGTIGGLFATNLSGPRRLAAGAGRDHILGVSCVSGRGEVFKAGGRVVKNVTGFDLPKLLAGSFGTLAAMTEITFKVMPAPDSGRTLLVRGLSDINANRLMTRALQSPHEVSGAAHLPGSVTAIRVEGAAPSVVHRCQALRRDLADGLPTEELQTTASAEFWREVRDVTALAGAAIVWRLLPPPASAARLVAAITVTQEVRAVYDRGGGLVWLAVTAPDAAADTVRRAIAATGGIATLVRAPADIRAHVPVFQPLPEPLRKLSERVKEAFDPQRILNPGRMYAGM